MDSSRVKSTLTSATETGFRYGLPMLYKASEQSFRYGMPLLEKCKPLLLVVLILYGFTRSMVLALFLVYKSGFKNLFTWKSRVIPEFANDTSLGVHSTFKTSDGVKLHMVTRGNPKNPVILFLHGFPENWYSWRSQMEYFSKNYKCVALSMRGYADSDKPQGVENYVMSKLENDVKETIEFLGVKHVILVAHDWGGAVAWSFTMAYPEKVSKLVICNAPHPAIFKKLLFSEISQFWASWYMFFFLIPVIPELFIRMGNFLFLNLCFHTLLQQKKLTQEELELYKFYASDSKSLTAMINYYRASMNPKSQVVKRKSIITNPTLLIWGEKDTALTIKCLDGVNNYVEDLTIMRLPEASHWVQQDCPDAVNDTITNFL